MGDGRERLEGLRPVLVGLRERGVRGPRHRRAKELGYEVKKIEPVAVGPSESAMVSAET